MIRSKITLIKGVSLAALKLKSGQARSGGSGNWGMVPKASHSLKEKALGSLTNSTHALAVKHPHKISSWFPSTQTQSPTRIYGNPVVP